MRAPAVIPKCRSVIVNLPGYDTPTMIGASRSIIDAVKLLLSTLSVDEQERALQEITEEIRPIPAPRAGDVLGAIIKFLPRRPQWTMREIKNEVAATGVDATDKEVYNSIGYLTRKRHIKRIGYGQYVVVMETASRFVIRTPAPDASPPAAPDPISSAVNRQWCGAGVDLNAR